MNKIKLGDLVEFQRGYDLPKSKIQNGKYPVVTSNGILGYHNEYKSEPSIVIGRSGTIGNPQLINEKFWAHNTTLFVKNFKGNDLKYIYYLLLNTDINKMKSGSNIPTLNRNHLHPILVNATTNKILQKKIATVLSNIDDNIELNNKINAELEAMAKTIYDYWFLQFEFPNEEGKPYKSSGGKMVWNEELKREIPEGWEVNKLGNIFSFIKGKNPDSLSNEKNSYNLYPYINIEVATGGKIQFCNGKSMILSDGETIMVMDGAASGEIYIGNSGVLGSTFSKLVSKDENISNSLIYQILEKIKPVYKKANIGSTVPHANKSFIENIQIALPKNVSYFSNSFDEIYSKININKKENRELVSLREFLLPLLMNGQVGFRN